MNFCAAILAAMLLALGAKEAAVGARPPMWTESQVWTANVKSDPVQPIHFGKLLLVLEKTTLADVRSALGSGAIFQNGDAGESLSWLCYTFASGMLDQTVWLSSSEMGGGEVIDGVTAMQLNSKSPALRNCARLPRNYGSIHLANGLWLGATEAQVLSALGKPQKHGDSWSYVFEGKDGEYAISSNLAFKLRGGKVIGIVSSRLTSN